MTIKARVILQTRHPVKYKMLTTFELYYPRVAIHEEFLTHRAISRNASSSRAVSTANMIRQVKLDPVMPARWGVAGKGMVDGGPMTKEGEEAAIKMWLKARDEAVAMVGSMETLTEKPHKQITNTILRPWEHITVVASGTEWANFFALRRDSSAKPEFQKLANQMYEAMKTAETQDLKVGEWHLPFIELHELDALHDAEGQFDKYNEILNQLKKVSAARCARTSFKNGVTRPISFEDDLKLYDRLCNSGLIHASPLEHVAQVDDYKIYQDGKKLKVEWSHPNLHGNFEGFNQLRKFLPNENITKMPTD